MIRCQFYTAIDKVRFFLIITSMINLRSIFKFDTAFAIEKIREQCLFGEQAGRNGATMKKLRSYLAVFALLATLGGPFFVQASGAMASVAIHRAGSAVAMHFYKPPCPVPTQSDC